VSIADPDIHDEDHDAAKARLEHQIATGYAATTLAERDRLDMQVAAEEDRFEWETGNCSSCAKTRHPSCVCTKHRQRWNIPD
jgi:hypothetical protein